MELGIDVPRRSCVVFEGVRALSQYDSDFEGERAQEEAQAAQK